LAIFTWSDDDVVTLALICIFQGLAPQNGARQCIHRAENRLVRLLGRKYCDAVKCWRFEYLTRVTAVNMSAFTLDRQAKHQYSAASGAFSHCDKAGVD